MSDTIVEHDAPDIISALNHDESLNTSNGHGANGNGAGHLSVHERRSETSGGRRHPEP